MAVTQTMQWFHDRHYCLLTDPDADAAEIVFEEGFWADTEERLIDFVPAYFSDAKVSGLSLLEEITVRFDQETDRPVGLLIEHVSKRKLPRGGLFRRAETVDGAAAPLLLIADSVVIRDYDDETESDDENESPSPLRRHNGGWILEGERVPLETAF